LAVGLWKLFNNTGAKHAFTRLVFYVLARPENNRTCPMRDGQCADLSRVLPAGLARMEIVIFMTVRFENHAISVLKFNTSTQVASTCNLPPRADVFSI
jgi:hypothetical protein